jgi:hypothetical protein
MDDAIGGAAVKVSNLELPTVNLVTTIVLHYKENILKSSLKIKKIFYK